MRSILKWLYAAILRALNIGERRCGWCQKFLGYKRGLRGATTHGMCEQCKMRWDADLDKQEAAQIAARKQSCRSQRPLRKTLRRRTGGWSGAVACREL